MNSQHLTSIARILAARWSLPKLAEDVQIDYSKRMTTALGLCLPERRTIRLNYKLRDKDTGLIEEVLCHELAHLAIYQKFGRKVKPHGPEWRDLMQRAGYTPKRRLNNILRTKKPKVTKYFEHKCPVCQANKIARSARPRWHCLECLESGLESIMVVTASAP